MQKKKAPITPSRCPDLVVLCIGDLVRLDTPRKAHELVRHGVFQAALIITRPIQGTHRHILHERELCAGARVLVAGTDKQWESKYC